MKKKLLTFKLLVLLGSLIIGGSIATAQDTEGGFTKGVIRVKLTPEAASQLTEEAVNISEEEGIDPVRTGLVDFNILNGEFRATKLKRVFRPAGRFETRHREYGLDLWYEVRVDSTISTEELITKYGELTEVEHVEMQASYRKFGQVEESGAHNRTMTEKPNDPLYHNQWHYENVGQTEGRVGSDANVRKAWTIETGRPEVVVAVLDGGIDINHEDLKDNLWVNEDEIPNNGIDDDRNGYVDDIHGWNFADNMSHIIVGSHGTHVAGTIAATNNNGIGLAGVAGGSGKGDGIRLMTCVTFSYHPNYGDIVGGFEEAFIYAADNGATISNNSWGGGLPSVLMEDCINYYIANAGKNPVTGEFEGALKGGLPIFAAGNFSATSAYTRPNVMYPANLEQVFAVANTDHADRKHLSSCFGPQIDISAPGTAIYSTLPGNKYGGPAWTGTSMASPHVTGIAALLASKYLYELTPDQVKARLQATAKNIDDYNPTMAGYLGAGRIDAYAALVDDAEEVPAIADWGFYGYDENSFDIGWLLVTNKFGVRINDYQVLVAEGRFHGEDSVYSEEELASIVEVATAYEHHVTTTGTVGNLLISPLEPNTTYTVCIRAKDVDGNFSPVSAPLVATTWRAGVLALTDETPLEVNINVENGQYANAPFSFKNTGEGVSRFYWLVEGFGEMEEEAAAAVAASLPHASSASETFAPSALEYQAPVDTGIQPLLSPSFDESPNFYTYLDTVRHDTKDNPDFMRSFSEFHDGDKLGVVIANKFVAERDMELTHVSAFIATEIYDPIKYDFGIYVGGEDGPTGEPLASTGKYVRGLRNGGWFETTLSAKVNVKAGQTFWVVVGTPDGISYPIGTQTLAKTGASFVRLHKGLHYYTDAGQVWGEVFMVRAYEGKRNAELVRFDIPSGRIEPNQEIEITPRFDGQALNNGRYEIPLIMMHDDPKQGAIRKYAHVTVTGHNPELTASVAEIDFGTLFKSKASDYVEVMLKNEGKETLTNLQIVVEGADASKFYIYPKTVAELKPGYETKIRVRANSQSSGLESSIYTNLNLNADNDSLQIPMKVNYIVGPQVEYMTLLTTDDSVTVYDTLMSGVQVDSTFLIMNTGNQVANFEFDQEDADIINISPASGALQPGDTLAVNFTLNLIGQNATTYAKSFIVSMKYDGSTKSVYAAKAFVAGEPNFEVDTTTVIDFGELIAGSGETVARGFEFSNTGSDKQYYKVVALSDSSVFSFERFTASDSSGTATLAPNAVKSYGLFFSPIEEGTYTDTVSVITLDASKGAALDTFNIVLSGVALPSPKASFAWNGDDLSKDSLAYGTEAGKSATVTISNTKPGTDLIYTVYAPEWMKINNRKVDADSMDNGFGYTYTEIDYEWEDISEIGISLKDKYANNKRSTQLELTKFVFPYFGREYTTFNAFHYGFIAFDLSETTYGNVPSYSFPYTYGPGQL
ncbi:S8 family serine peptidase [Limibacter armeniacum]|uniref:S8 family serine peptidase n=1 Tax=Limibacter armeniacum TaxID=466084 RepID=UPI002FE51C64